MKCVLTFLVSAMLTLQACTPSNHRRVEASAKPAATLHVSTNRLASSPYSARLPELSLGVLEEAVNRDARFRAITGTSDSLPFEIILEPYLLELDTGETAIVLADAQLGSAGAGLKVKRIVSRVALRVNRLSGGVRETVVAQRGEGAVDLDIYLSADVLSRWKVSGMTRQDLNDLRVDTALAAAIRDAMSRADTRLDAALDDYYVANKKIE